MWDTYESPTLLGKFFLTNINHLPNINQGFDQKITENLVTRLGFSALVCNQWGLSH